MVNPSAKVPGHTLKTGIGLYLRLCLYFVYLIVLLFNWPHRDCTDVSYCAVAISNPSDHLHLSAKNIALQFFVYPSLAY